VGSSIAPLASYLNCFLLSLLAGCGCTAPMEEDDAEEERDRPDDDELLN